MHRLTVSTKLVKHEKFFTLNVLSKHKSGKQFKLNASSWERSLQFWCCGALPTNWSPVSTLHELRTETQFQNWCTTTITHTYEANTHMIAIPHPVPFKSVHLLPEWLSPAVQFAYDMRSQILGLTLNFYIEINDWMNEFFIFIIIKQQKYL